MSRPASKLHRVRGALLYLALAIIVSACGYHLRGNIKIDPQYLPVKVVDAGVNAEIKPRLIRLLNESNIPVVEDDSARLLITIQGVEFEKRLVSAANQASIDTFEVGMKLRYKFSSGNKDLLSWQDLRTNRILQFSKSAVVSSATEESTLRDDLLSDAISQIVTRLRYLNELEPAEHKQDKSDTTSAVTPVSSSSDAANSDAAVSDPASSDSSSSGAGSSTDNSSATSTNSASTTTDSNNSNSSSAPSADTLPQDPAGANEP